MADAAYNDVDIFELGELPEIPVTESATAVTATTALLHGTLKPAGRKIRYHFGYGFGASCSEGFKTAAREGEGSVSEEVTGLEPDTSYKFCFVAENAYGHSAGSEESFMTPPAVEGVSGCAANGVTDESATLQASLEPKGSKVEYWFEYGKSESYGSKANVDESESAEAVAAKEPVSGLEPNQTYDCRLTAGRKIEGQPYTTNGENGTFRTQAIPPVVEAQPAGFVGTTTATLVAKVGPEHSATQVHFQYGKTEAYGQSTPEEAAGSGLGDTVVGQRIEGLEAGVTYHFRVVAVNEQGMVEYGPDGVFTTSTGVGDAPVASTGPANGVTQTSATLSGTVDPEGYATSYVFEVGTSTGYGTDISGTLPGAGAEPQGVTLALENLAPDTTYHYRLSATNANGTGEGQDETFTTPGNTYSLTLPLTPPLIATPAIAFPTETGTTSKPATKTPTRAQRLAKAQRQCRKDKSKRKQAGCERRAHKRYGPVKKK